MNFTPVILCVDDDEDDLLFIREAINSEPHQFRIETCRDGAEAIRYLENCIASRSFPCLVIMDMNMPIMNGRQTIQKIRENENLAGIPLAVFTTSSNESDKKFFEDQGIHFITKPFDYKMFINEIVSMVKIHTAH